MRHTDRFDPDLIPDGTPEELEEVYGITEGNVWEEPEPEEPQSYGIPGDTWEGVYYVTQPNGRRKYIYSNLEGASRSRDQHGLRIRQPKRKFRRDVQPVTLNMAMNHLKPKKPPRPIVGRFKDPCGMPGCDGHLFRKKPQKTPSTPMCLRHYSLWKHKGKAFESTGTTVNFLPHLKQAHMFRGQLLERTLVSELEARGIREPWRAFLAFEKVIHNLIEGNHLAKQTEQYLIPRITRYYVSDHLPIYLYRKCLLPQTRGGAPRKHDVRLITKGVFIALVALWNLDMDDPRFINKRGQTIFDPPSWRRLTYYTLNSALNLSGRNKALGGPYKARGPHDAYLDGMSFETRFKSFFSRKILDLFYKAFQPYMPEGWSTHDFIRMLVVTKVNPSHPLWIDDEQGARLQKIVWGPQLRGQTCQINRPFIPEKYRPSNIYEDGQYYRVLNHPEETAPLLAMENLEDAQAAFNELVKQRQQTAKQKRREATLLRRKQKRKQKYQQKKNTKKES